MRKIIKTSIGIVVLGVFFCVGIAQAEDAEKIMKKIEQTYKNINSFQADFTIKQQSGGEKLKIDGRIWNEKDRFRIEMKTIAPIPGEKGKIENKLIKQTIVFDGKIIWVYSNQGGKEQIMILDSSKLDELSDSDPIKKQGEEAIKAFKRPAQLFSPNYYINVKEGNVTVSEKNGFYVFENENKQTEVWVTKKDYLMHQIITRDKKGNNISNIEFTEIKINKDIPDKLFTFKVPAGIEPIDIIDMLKRMYKEPQKNK